MVVFLDDECLERMKEQNAFLVPTLCAPQCIIDKGVENGVAKYAVDKTLKVKDAHVESVKKAYENGIPIALGTDAERHLITIQIQLMKWNFWLDLIFQIWIS